MAAGATFRPFHLQNYAAVAEGVHTSVVAAYPICIIGYYLLPGLVSDLDLRLCQQGRKGVLHSASDLRNEHH